VQDRLAGVGGVVDPGQARDRRHGAARLVGGDATELHRRVNAVAGRPDPPRAANERVVAGEDEALVAGELA
jgi:hypothetical protein